MTVRGAFSKHKVEGKVRAGGPVVDIAVDSGNIDHDSVWRRESENVSGSWYW